MYLKLIKEAPNNLFLNCPYNFKDKDSKIVFNCTNCKDTPCISVCKQNAIYYSSKNIISIDQSKCNGCGNCLKACSKNAILLRNKKAYKCDLCSNQSFTMFCYKNNPNYLELIDDVDDTHKQKVLNKYLGYKIINYKILKRINNKIIDNTENQRIYAIKHPNLSIDELEIINYILDSYKDKEEKIEKLDAVRVREDLDNELVNYCYSYNLELDEDQFNYLLDTAFNNLFNYGPLTELLNDYDLEEIAILGINKPLYVYHRLFGWLETNLIYMSNTIVKDLINKLSWHSNKYITLKNPILDTYLKDNSRLNAIINPITESSSVTIRKFSEKPFIIKDLIKLNTISLDAAIFLSLVFLTDCNVLVVGNTGSGKTTTLNTLLSFVPEDERFVVVEEVREINIPHRHKVFTLVNPELNINLDTLVINTLRMRPDRVVIGEVRSKEESRTIIESMLCGQAKGTYTTFHAQSGNEALLRLRSYGIMESDLGVIDLIITQKRYNKYTNGKSKDLRNITEINEVIFQNNKLVLNKLFEFDMDREKLIKINNPKNILNKFKLAFGIRNLKDYTKLLNKQKKTLNLA